MPVGFSGSVSHKRRIAVALAARDEGSKIGIDVEEVPPLRIDISERVLTDGELASLRRLPDVDRWRATMVRFSLKEAIYKALDPFVQRYVGFKEVALDVDTRLPSTPFRPAIVELNLAKGEGPFAADATFAEREGCIVSTAQISAKPS